jgi:hypothetical protein
VRRRAWAWLLVVPAAMFVLVAATAPFSTFHHHLYLSGTPQRFAATVVRAGRSDARAALWLGNVFALSWLLVVPRCLRAGLDRWAPERRRLVPLWRAAPTVALLAGCVALLGNALALSQVGKRRPPTGVTLAIASLTWTKWMLYAVALAGLMVLVIGPLMAPVVRPTMRRLFAGLDRAHADPDDAHGTADTAGTAGAVDAPASPRIGLAVSADRVPFGSAVVLGMLRRFDEARPDGPSLFVRADSLVAAAGAAPIAGGWRAAASARTAERREARRDGSFDAGAAWADHVGASLVRLAHGPLAPFGGAGAVVARCVVAAVTAAAGAYVIGAMLGSAIRTRAIHSAFPYTDRTADTIMGLRELLPLRLVLPGLVLIVVGTLLHAASRRRPDLEQYASAAVVGGFLLVVLLLVVPIIVRYARWLLGGLPFVPRADNGALVIGCVALAVLAFGVRLLIVARPSFLAGRLLISAAAGVLVVLIAGKAADTFARGIDGAWASWPLPGVDSRLPVIVPALLWLGAVAIVPPHRLWLFDRTRRTMVAAFLPGGDRAWTALRPVAGPNVMIVGTIGSSASVVMADEGITAHSGLSDRGVRVATASLPMGSWWDGFPTRWTVGHSMGLIGLSNGAWLPNLRAIQWFADPVTSPRVHPGLALGRLLGRHRPDRDSFVHVGGGDGTGVLTLIELLRSRPDVAFSTGTGTGDARSFLAGVAPLLVDIGITLTVDADADAGRDAGRGTGPAPSATMGRTVPASDVATATMRYDDGTSGLLIHGVVRLDGGAAADSMNGAIARRISQHVEAGHALAGRMVGLFDRRTP